MKTTLPALRSRNGKIARLPLFIRDQLNERLERSQPGPKLLHWLNSQPDVQEILRDEFDGAPINKQNISHWRQGGFQEWQARRDLCQEARGVAECGLDLDNEASDNLAHITANIIAARIGGMVTHWNGQVDEAFESKARILNGLCRSVAQLQRTIREDQQARCEMEDQEEEREKQTEEEQSKKLMDLFMDKMQEPKVATMFGGGEAGEKMARMFLALQRGDMEALMRDKAEAEAVKATPKKPAAKAKAPKQDKPLKEKEITAGKKKAGQGQSRPVKVSAPSNEGLGLGLGLGGEEDVSPVGTNNPISPITPPQTP